MAGKKRSEIQGPGNRESAVPGVSTFPSRRSASAGREYRQAFCPVCCTAHGYKRGQRPMSAGGEMNALMNYWDFIELRETDMGFEEHPPFGCIQEAGRGKGQDRKFIRYFGPDDDPDGFFPLVKQRLVKVVKRWIVRGWLSPADLGLKV